MSQVERIVAKVKTKLALARLCGVEPSAVSHMIARGGLIPVRHHQKIIDGALEKHGVVITPDDFFDLPPSSKRSRKAAMRAAAE